MPRPDVSEERTNQVLDAAMKVFARFGFYKARMDDIAEEAKISKGLLYWYFKSKDSIISAILKRFFSISYKDSELLQDKSKSASERLLLLTQSLLKSLEREAALIPLGFEFYAVAARQEAVRSFLKEYFKEYLQRITDLVQDGIDSGEFRQANATEVAMTIVAIYEGLFLLCVVDPQAVNMGKQIFASVELVLSGLKTANFDIAK